MHIKWPEGEEEGLPSPPVADITLRSPAGITFHLELQMTLWQPCQNLNICSRCSYHLAPSSTTTPKIGTLTASSNVLICERKGDVFSSPITRRPTKILTARESLAWPRNLQKWRTKDPGPWKLWTVTRTCEQKIRRSELGDCVARLFLQLLLSLGT